MLIDDVFVEVRDKTLKRQGTILPQDLSLKAKLRWCAVGEWELTLPGNHVMVPELLKPGSGLVVRGPVGETLVPRAYSGYSERRRNYAWNPRWTNPSRRTSSAAGSTGTYSLQPTGGPTPEVQGWARYVFTKAPTSSPVNFGFSGSGGNADPVEPDTEYTFSAWGITDYAGLSSTRIDVRWFDSSGAQIASVTGPSSAVYTPNVWHRRSNTLTSPSNAATVRVDFCFSGPTGVSVGQYVGWTGCLIEKGDQLRDPFDGNTDNTELERFTFVGDANASATKYETRTVTREPRYDVVQGVLFSGPTVLPNRKRNQKNPDGTLTFKGVTDEIHLQDALAYPDPQGANGGDPLKQSKANDTRTGSAEGLLRAYYAYNMASTHAKPERIRGFRQYARLGGTSQSRGPNMTKSPRFQNLLELLQEIATVSGLGFRLYQVDGELVFYVNPVRDVRQTVRLDVRNGTVTSEETQERGPGLTDALILGQGEGTARKVVRRQDTAGETVWGRVIEQAFDRRDTNDTLELQQKGDEELELASGGLAVKLIPSDDQTMQYGRAWREGDWVAAVVDGKQLDSVVTEAVIQIDSGAVRIGAAIGDVTAFKAEDQAVKKQQALDSRVSYLERAGQQEIDPSQFMPANAGPFVPSGPIYKPSGFNLEYTGVERSDPFFHVTKGDGFNGPYLLGTSDDTSPTGYVWVHAHKGSGVYGLHDHHPTSTATMYQYQQRSTAAPIHHHMALVAKAAPRTLYSVGGGITNAGDHAMYYGPGDGLYWAFTADGRGAVGYGDFRVLATPTANPNDHTLRVAGEWIGVHGKVVGQHDFPGWASEGTGTADATQRGQIINKILVMLVQTGWFKDPPA